MSRRPFMLCLKIARCALVLGAMLPTHAAQQSEQDDARYAVQAGLALPFQAVRERVARYCGNCELLEAKLHEEKEDGRRFLVYEIKAITPDGQVLKMKIAAANGEILKIKRKGMNPLETR
ncbi:hypothetical protein [Uliginosibacterium sediminicola]|uniref:PepSY domain-containing protein n=1 Tax=Uliginosibacterium sediminicola TaxID=2024550 RepID=A0ABU9Z219_9RHOO